MNQEHHIQKFTFGKATFKTTFQIIKEVKKIIEQSKDIQTKLKDCMWYISERDYLKYNWKKMFLYMSECFAQQLDLRRNDTVQIISQIQYVQYSNLKKLNLEGNSINNIQSLSSINFKCLQYLDLCKNQISQIKCVNKLSIPSLKAIDLQYNSFNEIYALTRSKINSKVSSYLSLQYFCSNADPINQDLSVIVKLISQLIKYLYVGSKKRINQARVSSMLKMRFPYIHISKKF